MYLDSGESKPKSLSHLLLRLISTLLKLEIFNPFQALEDLKFQDLEGLKFQNKQTQKQMIQTYLLVIQFC